MKPLRVGGVLFLLLGFFSCTGNAPELGQVYWEIQWHQIPGEEGESPRVEEALSLYVQAEDPDGDDDFDRLLLLHRDSRLFWDWGPDEWVSFEEEGLRWLGSGKVTLPLGAEMTNLPRGVYEVQLRDQGGNQTERLFRLSAPQYEPEEISFPGWSETKTGLSLEPASREVSLWVYGERDDLLSRKTFPKGTFTWDDLLENPGRRGQAHHFMLYEGDPQREMGLLSGPFFMRQLEFWE